MLFKKLVVGVDFSEKSERAVTVALRLAAASGGAVVVVNAVPSSPEVVPTGKPEDAQIESIERRLRDYTADLAKSSGLAVDYGAVHGNDAAAALNGFVSKWGGDVLVVGSAARTGVERIVIGSVASRLVATSAVPVLVIGPHAVV